jgi:hypothetical protein
MWVLCKTVFHCCDKYLREAILREKRFIFAQAFRDFCSFLAHCFGQDKYCGDTRMWQRGLLSSL